MEVIKFNKKIRRMESLILRSNLYQIEIKIKIDH